MYSYVTALVITVVIQITGVFAAVCDVSIIDLGKLHGDKPQVFQGDYFVTEIFSNSSSVCDVSLRIEEAKPIVAALENAQNGNLSLTLNSRTNVTIKGEFVGFAKVFYEDKYVIFRVLRKPAPQIQVFNVILPIIIVFANLGLGLTLDYLEIVAVLKKPISPAIGFVCQFLVMPLIAFGVINAVDMQPRNLAIGIFAMGCSPGGGMSNYHTLFLGGDVNLSVTMTVVSTIAALGMMPLWISTLGSQLAGPDTPLSVPFIDIVKPLLFSVIPFAIGLAVKYKWPKAADKVFRFFVRPLMAVIVIGTLITGVWANIYIFQLMKPRLIIVACLLPYVGFTIGFICGMIFRQGKKKAITIAVETGIQNGAIAVAVLTMALPHPDSDLAVAGPMAVTLFTPLPLFVVEIGRAIYLKFIKKPETDKEADSKDVEEDGKSKRVSTITTDTEVDPIPSTKSQNDAELVAVKPNGNGAHERY